MTRFEYFSVQNDSRLADQTMNAFGGDGWELVTMIFERPFGWVYTFKRPKVLKLK